MKMLLKNAAEEHPPDVWWLAMMLDATTKTSAILGIISNWVNINVLVNTKYLILITYLSRVVVKYAQLTVMPGNLADN